MRKPVAALIMLIFMVLWIWGAGTVGTNMTGAPRWLQLVFYVAAGTLWILPLRPLFKWMNTNETPDED